MGLGLRLGDHGVAAAVLLPPFQVGWVGESKAYRKGPWVVADRARDAC